MRSRYRQIAILLILASAAPMAAAQTGSLQGRAYLGRRAPVIGATALVQSQENGADLYLTSSDAKGIFRVDGLENGLYRVRVEREGLVPRDMEDISVKYPFRAVVELAMVKAGKDRETEPVTVPEAGDQQTLISVVGEVMERNVGPLSEIHLRFVKKGGGDDPRILRSADDGSFALPAMTAGPWYVEVNGVGLLPLRFLLDLERDVTLTVIMVRQQPGHEQTPLDLMPPEQPIPPKAG